MFHVDTARGEGTAGGTAGGDTLEDAGTVNPDELIPPSMKGSATAVWNTVKDLHLELLLMYHRVTLKLANLGPSGVTGEWSDGGGGGGGGGDDGGGGEHFGVAGAAAHVPSCHSQAGQPWAVWGHW